MICNAYEYIPETDIMMYINYTSIKKKFFLINLKKGKETSLSGLLLDVSLSFVIMVSKDK